MTQEALNRALQQDYRRAMGTPTSPSFVADAPLLPVKAIGQGVLTQNARQRLKSYTVYKTAAATTYTQIATVTSSLNIYFLGVTIAGNQNDKIWIEDAASGNISVSDNSTSGLLYTQVEQPAGGLVTINQILSWPRLCTSGIRVAVQKSSTNETALVFYFLEEDV